jgi:hypothetical protein
MSLGDLVSLFIFIVLLIAYQKSKKQFFVDVKLVAFSLSGFFAGFMFDIIAIQFNSLAPVISDIWFKLPPIVAMSIFPTIGLVCGAVISHRVRMRS